MWPSRIWPFHLPSGSRQQNDSCSAPGVWHHAPRRATRGDMATGQAHRIGQEESLSRWSCKRRATEPAHTRATRRRLESHEGPTSGCNTPWVREACTSSSSNAPMSQRIFSSNSHGPYGDGDPAPQQGIIRNTFVEFDGGVSAATRSRCLRRAHTDGDVALDRVVLGAPAAEGDGEVCNHCQTDVVRCTCQRDGVGSVAAGDSSLSEPVDLGQGPVVVNGVDHNAVLLRIHRQRQAAIRLDPTNSCRQQPASPITSRSRRGDISRAPARIREPQHRAQAISVPDSPTATPGLSPSLARTQADVNANPEALAQAPLVNLSRGFWDAEESMQRARQSQVFPTGDLISEDGDVDGAEELEEEEAPEEDEEEQGEVEGEGDEEDDHVQEVREPDLAQLLDRVSDLRRRVADLGGTELAPQLVRLTTLLQRVKNLPRGMDGDMIEARTMTMTIGSNAARDEEGTSNATQRQCMICLDEFASLEKLRVLPCFHRYHCYCIDNWLSRNSHCPVCKYDISSNCVHQSDSLLHVEEID